MPLARGEVQLTDSSTAPELGATPETDSSTAPEHGDSRKEKAMKFTKSALEFIHKQISDTPPETGGILGSRDGIVVSEVIMDKPKGAQYACFYAPDIEFFNTCIEQWQKENIAFAGIFHTHFFDVGTLSDADKEYITSIMNAMPDEITELFFPIYTLPKRELICYRAVKHGDSIRILSENKTII